MTEAKILRALALFSLLAMAAWFLAAARGVLAAVFLAGLLAFVLNPLVYFLQRRGVRRSAAVVGLYALFAVLFLGLAYWAGLVLWQDIPRLREQLPSYVAQVKAGAAKLQAIVAEEWPWVREKGLLEQAAQRVVELAEGSLRAAPSYLSSAVEIVFYLVLVPFVAFYFLRGGRDGLQAVLEFCPARWTEKFISLVHEVDAVLGNYLRALFLEALAVGVLSAAGLCWLGVDYWPLIAAASGLGNIVPYLGPTVGGVLGAAAAFFQFQDLAMPLKVLGVFAAVQFVDNWILQPVIMKRGVDLHPVVGILALLCGGQLAGFWGLLLAVPVACVVHELVKIFAVWYLKEHGGRRASKDFTDAAAKPWVV